MPSGVQMPPSSTEEMAEQIWSIEADLEMKPEAPSSSARRIVSGSSCADTTTTGSEECCPRIATSPERPLAPGMERSSRTRSASALAAISALAPSKSPASRIRLSGPIRIRACFNAPRKSG